MEDIREQMEVATEITNAISEPIGFGMDFDDVRASACRVSSFLSNLSVQDELSAELDELCAQSLDEQLLGTDIPSMLPTAPSQEPAAAAPVAGSQAAAAPAAQAETAEDAEFRKLQEEMSAA